MGNLLKEISGSKVNFLIGSGASVPVFKTLSLGEGKPSLEDLLSCENILIENKKLLYYIYYRDWILPMSKEIEKNKENDFVKKQYSEFIESIVSFLNRESNEIPKRINIFTTNYDTIFEDTFENYLSVDKSCYFNDGAMGFKARILDSQFYNININKTGYGDKFKKECPIINLIKMHGSISWKKKEDKIEVNYDGFKDKTKIAKLNELDLYELVSNNSDVNEINLKLTQFYTSAKEDINNFYDKYIKLPIINPDKWKFHETVFEQHYYQQLRNFSYELEKKDAVLIVFGFSFADEHILEIFERSLSNPTLQVFIISYSNDSKELVKSKFKAFKNIIYLPNTFKNVDGSEIKGNFVFLNNLLKGEDYE